MFTGIVQSRGRVAQVRRTAAGLALVIERRGWPPRGVALSRGDSVCVSGVCLTLVRHTRTNLHFDVIPETLTVTTLGDLRVGDEVNLESSMTASTPIAGHFVQGHVDTTGVVTRSGPGKDGWRLDVRPPASFMDYVIPKGAIAIDGVSLTIAKVSPGSFGVALIPTTLDITTLGRLRAGSRVNLEADIMVKTTTHVVRRLMRRKR